VVVVNMAVPTNTPVPPTSTPVPPTNTPVPPTSTATVASQNGSTRVRPTKTAQPSLKSTSTGVASAIGSSGVPPKTSSTATPEGPVPPANLPVTGFGGARAVGHNVAVGQVYRAAHGNVTLGITGQPQTGGGSSPLTPILPVILGSLVVALGVLTRRFAFARQ
jgi:hypothetical protein